MFLAQNFKTANVSQDQCFVGAYSNWNTSTKRNSSKHRWWNQRTKRKKGSSAYTDGSPLALEAYLLQAWNSQRVQQNQGYEEKD